MAEISTSRMKGLSAEAAALAGAFFGANFLLVLLRLPQLPVPPSHVLLRQVVLTLAGLLVCALLYRVITRFQGRSGKVLCAALFISVPAGALLTAASVIGVHYLLSGAWHRDSEIGILLSATSYWTWFFAAWAAALLSVATRRTGAHAPGATGGEARAARRNQETDFWVSERGHKTRVNVDDIWWIEASGDYVLVHLTTGSKMMHTTLTSLEQLLKPAEFVRVHRRAIVRRDTVAEIERLTGGNFRLRLTNGEWVYGSRRSSKAILSIAPGASLR